MFDLEKDLHYEFYVEFKNGGRDWVDPVINVYEDDNFIFVESILYTYEYGKHNILNYTIRVMWVGDD